MSRSLLKDKKWSRLSSSSFLLVICGIVLAIIEKGAFWVGLYFFQFV